MRKTRYYRSNILLLTSFLAVISAQLLLGGKLNNQLLFTLIFFSCFLWFILLMYQHLYTDLVNNKQQTGISDNKFLINSLSHTGLTCLQWDKTKELICLASDNLTENLNLSKDLIVNNHQWLKQIYVDDKKNLISFLNTTTNNFFRCRIIDGNNNQTEFILTHLFDQSDKTIVTLNKSGAAHTMKSMNNSPILRDNLTGLITKPLFIDRVEQSLRLIDRHKNLLALLAFDINQFKEVSANLSAIDSNFIIKNTARRILESVRISDTVARIGSDEFIVLLPGLKEEQDVSQITQSILELIQEPIQLKNTEIKITATAAITIAPDDGVTADMLLKNLRLTLFQSKRDSFNHFQYFSHKLTNLAKQQVLIENHLKDGIRKKEFYIHYQPIYSIHQTMLGYNGAIHWQHPVNGLLKQEDFSSIAEKSGLISPLVQQVYKQALLKIQNYNLHQGSCCFIHLSLFSKLLTEPQTINIFERLLLENGFNPRFIILRVREEDLFSPTEPILDTIEQLANLGIQIYLDDFSNHYTSLLDLHRIPIKGIVLNYPELMEITQQDSDVVSSIINVAKQMELKVAIKEISTKQQYQQVTHLSFNSIEGSFFQASGITSEVDSVAVDKVASTQIA